jgi:hypothetical protein
MGMVGLLAVVLRLKIQRHFNDNNHNYFLLLTLHDDLNPIVGVVTSFLLMLYLEDEMGICIYIKTNTNSIKLTATTKSFCDTHTSTFALGQEKHIYHPSQTLSGKTVLIIPQCSSAERS